MGARRIPSTPVGCSNCRLALLKAFISNAGSLSRPVIRPAYPKLGVIRPKSGRPFSTCNSWRFRVAQVRQLEHRPPESEATAEQHLTQAENELPTSTASTPWYLQVESPRRQLNPLLERQEIPELPPDPPPLLKPMLEHISVDLGLDSLLIFDLRKIDPPPALGANLLMVIGTARSEKHLHVSADRFCKWLKRTHKLSPYADGLLGRGELKLKLKRKARRARLLSSVGSSETRDVDDGLRTGWICVNVGTIDDGKGTTESYIGNEGYVGFGGEVEGAKVVIQMLTEGKREELDLEGLWSKIQQRQERKDELTANGQEELLSRQESSQSSLHHEAAGHKFSSALSPRYSNRVNISFNQVRHYHHGAVSAAEESRPWGDSDYMGLYKSSLEAVVKMPEDSSTLRETGTASWQSENVQLECHQGHFREASKPIMLRALVDHLERLPLQDALKALGRGANDFKSTPFLSSFYQSYPLFPSADHWECRLAVVCQGIKIGHSGYSKAHLNSLACELQSSLVEIPARVFSLIYKTFLIPNPQRADRRQGRPSIGPITLGHAVDALEAMSFRGHRILTDEICSDLLVGAIRMNRHSRGSSDQGPRRLKDLLDHVSDKPLDLRNELRILHECADQQKWSILEDFWRGFARIMRPRPKELYQALFKRVAQRNHQAYVIRMLRERVPEMAQEEPPVRFDKELAEAVMDCLLIAEPNVKSMAMDESHHDREWVRLWRHCQRILREDTD